MVRDGKNRDVLGLSPSRNLTQTSEIFQAYNHAVKVALLILGRVQFLLMHISNV